MNDAIPCPRCEGDGGWWEHDRLGDGNLEPAQVVKCDYCNGSGLDPGARTNSNYEIKRLLDQLSQSSQDDPGGYW